MNQHLQRALDDIESATAGIPAKQLTEHAEGKWSAAEILEHLAMAFGSTAKVFERCAQKGKPIGDVPNLKQRFFATVVTDCGFFPPGRKAPHMVVPTGNLSGDAALESIRKNLLEMDKQLARCYEICGRKGWLANHPVLGPLTIDQWPKFHRVHTHHHMKQIRKMRSGYQSSP
jgi:hypothetical protein